MHKRTEIHPYPNTEPIAPLRQSHLSAKIALQQPQSLHIQMLLLG